MSEIILDASALLALINQESGADVVRKHAGQALMSSVNISETAAILRRIGVPIKETKSILNDLVVSYVSFDTHQGFIAADLITQTKKYGLSFGDRACLSLAIERSLPVLTADKAWSKLDLGVEVILIR